MNFKKNTNPVGVQHIKKLGISPLNGRAGNMKVRNALKKHYASFFKRPAPDFGPRTFIADNQSFI